MRPRDSLRYDQTLFSDRDVFEFTYVPEQLNHRDSQLKELAILARPAVYGGSAHSAILRGPPGTGKTTTVRNLFAEIGEVTQKLVPVYVNCQQHRKPSAVYGCIYAKLTGNAPPTSGRYLDDTRMSIIRHLQERDAALLVCLDDANYLHEAGVLNTLLYQLLRLYEQWDVRAAGVFTVCSDLALNIRAVVDARVLSVFQPAEVEFPPYTKEEIREILSERIKQGLYPNVISGEVLDLIVEIAVQEQDVRIGIDLIRRAVGRAEREGRRTVTRDDITAVSGSATVASIRALAAALTGGERALLYRIAMLSQEEDADMTSGAVFEAAQNYLPMTKTTYQNRLRCLKRAGIVSTSARSKQGKGSEILLRFDPEEVMCACQEHQTFTFSKNAVMSGD